MMHDWCYLWRRAINVLPPFNSATVLLFLVWTLIFYEAINVFILERKSPTFIYEEAVINPHAVSRKQLLQLSVKIVRQRPCTTTITRYIQDSNGVRFDLPFSIIQTQKTGYEEYTRQFFLPPTISNGPATVYVSSRHECHWSHSLWPLVFPRSYDFYVVE